MPIMILLVAILLGMSTFEIILYAIEKDRPFRIPRYVLVFLAVVGFLKFLAMY